MFDVVWANPERELVGQRKARKEREKERRDTYSSGNHSSARSVVSVETETSSLRIRKPQSFLESIRLKKKKPEKQDAPSVSTSSRISAFSDNNTEIQDSTLPPPSLTTGGSASAQYDDGGSSIIIPQVPPLTPMTSPQKSLQSPLTPKSMASTRRRKKKKKSPPELQIHGIGSLSQPTSSTSPEIRPLSLRSSATSWNPGDAWESNNLPPTLKVIKTSQTTKSQKSPANTIRSSSGAATDNTSPSSVAALEDETLPMLSLNLSGIQKEILQMAAADQDTFWQRLTEEWGAWADAALYKELEMERKRWLLSALYSINPSPATGLARTTTPESRILAYFETQATASYIAALNAGIPVYHMAPSPLSNKLFPNVVPRPANRANSCASLSTTPQAFSHIYAQPLPGLVPASDIPAVLRNMHRALTPQGTLHLLLIDPMPARAVMGPRLQAWLDEHLLLNLERLFRCTSPTRLFPTWLRDAHFQVDTDAKVVCQFAAIFEDKGGVHAPEALAQTTDIATAAAEAAATDLAAANPPTDASVERQAQTDRQLQASQEEPTVQEEEKERKQKRLSSLVGQKLWQETWGPYVTGARWWWEDEACREECLRLETVWEYHIIDAVKKERYVTSQL